MRIWKGTVASGRATSREFESRFVPCKTTISWKNVDSNNLFDLLTPRSDKHVTSPYSIRTLFSKQVMRILKLIRYKVLP